MFTRAQGRALIGISMITGGLSLLSSSLIIYAILMRDRKNDSYHRIMLGLSICDIFLSAGNVFGILMMSEESNGYYGARGTKDTCTALGFMVHLGFGIFSYNAVLMVYYVLKIRYRLPDDKYAKYVEPFAHLICVVVPLAQALVGVFLDLFNPFSVSLCYFSGHPYGCNFIDSIDCERGENANKYLWAFFIVPASVFYAIINTSILLIWLTVREQARLVRIHGQSSVNTTLKNTTRQSILYAVAFLNTFVWVLVPVILAEQAYKRMDMDFQERIFPIQVLTHIFMPSQGCFSLFVFTQPRRCQLRREITGKPFWWYVWAVLFSTSTVERLARQENMPSYLTGQSMEGPQTSQTTTRS